MSDVAPRPVVLPPGTETCGCCDGVAAATPQRIFNRIGLGSIRYRIGEHADFRASLLAGLSSKDHPALAGLRTRDADDWTIALFDAFACAADVLTFYQERLANESYLRTATERVSLQEMGRLIGYRLRPGVAAETWLSFALEAPRAPPPGSSADPGAFVTGIPAALTLPAGVRVQSVPGPDEKPQIFETVEPLRARPEWNAIRPWLAAPRRAPGRGAIETYVRGVGGNLKPGDALLFVGAEFTARPATDNHWDFRLLDAVDPDPANDRTRLRWARPLGSVSPLSNPPAAPEVHVLRRKAAVFGHNAPMWQSLNAEFRRGYPGGVDAEGHLATEWPGFAISPLAAGADGGHLDLDTVQAGALPGGYAVLAKGEFNRPDESFPRGTYVELYRVSGAAEASRAEFALSGKVTRLALRGQNLDAEFFRFVRETSVWVQSERLALAPYPVEDAVAGGVLPLNLPFAAPPDGLLPGRRIVVNGIAAAATTAAASSGTTAVAAGAPVAHPATVVAAAAGADGDGTLLTITPPLAQPLLRASVVVHANVATATHGETVAQILGAGDAARPFQRFDLKRLPLTYRGADDAETGADSELTVRVGEVEWPERPTLFGAGPTDRAYALSTDEAGRLWVGFGDGVRGARLPSGVNNVRATYRQGIGRDGNVAAGTLTQLLARPLGLKGVANPLPASGGADAEDASQARRSMPLGTRTLGRAVSLLDYEDFALAFAGIAKAQARVLTVAAGTTIAITVAGQQGDAVPADGPLGGRLLKALRSSGDPHVGVTLLSYRPAVFRLGLKVKRDPAYAAAPLLAAVEGALRDRFGFEARALGQPVLESELIAAAHAVPGVVAVDIDFLWGGSAPAAQTVPFAHRTRLLAARLRVEHGVARPAELLTLAAGPLARLEEMA